MGNYIRTKRLQARRQRHEKLGKLRAKYAVAASEAEKQKIINKVGRIAPHLPEAEFLAYVKKPAAVQPEVPAAS